MTEPDPPKVHGVPPGTDFCAAFVAGLLGRTAGWDPMRLARVRIYVNTRRTGRRMTALLAASGARLLPRIVPVSELAVTEAEAGLPVPVPDLRRRLQLTRVIHTLLDRQPEIAPRAAAFDLAESLAGLMDEMFDEGVGPASLIGQDFGELSEHWARSAEVLEVIAPYFGPEGQAEMTGAARLAALVTRLESSWAAEPPGDPVIVAGSTGSRGSTHRLMAAVARLPQGAVVLPGFDFDLPAPVWKVLSLSGAEDHPQCRFAKFCATLALPPGAVTAWHGPATGGARNRLISLALRPAPVSDQWIVEGPRLPGLAEAARGMTLIEAPGPRIEALSIALALRRAVAEGRSAAVVTADRRLTRMIAAELTRWGIQPDDSAGEPLAQTAPGRLLRLTAEALADPVQSDRLLVILKHPLTHAGEGRGRHLLWTRDLELRLRREGHPVPGTAVLRDLALRDGAGREAWAGWIGAALRIRPVDGRIALAEHVRLHLAMAELLVAGPVPDDGGSRLWAGPDGAEARAAMAALEREADHGGDLTALEYRDLVRAMLARGEVRQTVRGHPQVRFWGTIEARVQGADLIVLGSLNDGLWPRHPPPDPWMNRRMRAEAGLTSPERRIGLSAHDFQQAAMAPEVILTRATLDGSAETVPSRWVSRLVNLLDGLPDTGRPALAAMRERGADWMVLAEAIDRPAVPVAPARRPAPRPPVAARPKELSVTEIQTLIRDPYAIYARHVLGLRKLDPLRPEPDALARGSVIHDVLERYIRAVLEAGEVMDAKALMTVADLVLDSTAHWPGIRLLWRARIAGFADWFIATEMTRAGAMPLVIEAKQKLHFPDPDFTLTGKPDRIDLLADRTLEIIDYKTGAAPKKDDILRFDRQLTLLAIMAEAGAFPEVAGHPVARLTHYALGREPRAAPQMLEPGEVDRARDEFSQLLAAWARRDRGYLARRAKEGVGWDGDYDQLARYGEWSAADWPEPEEVG
jgi:double-strand break repair protein AddB